MEKSRETIDFILEKIEEGYEVIEENYILTGDVNKDIDLLIYHAVDMIKENAGLSSVDDALALVNPLDLAPTVIDKEDVPGLILMTSGTLYIVCRHLSEVSAIVMKKTADIEREKKYCRE